MHGHAEVPPEVNEPRVPEVVEGVDSTQRGPSDRTVGPDGVDHKLDNAVALLQYASVRSSNALLKSDLEYAIRIMEKIRDGNWYPYPEMCYKWQGCPWGVLQMEKGDSDDGREKS